MDIAFEQKVRERAYEIWLAAGMMDGMAHEHWCAAERDLSVPKALKAKASAKAKPATAKKATTAKPGAAKAKKAPKTIN